MKTFFKGLLVAGTLFAVSACSHNASADDTGFYLGMDTGTAGLSSLVLGYQIDENIGIETTAGAIEDTTAVGTLTFTYNYYLTPTVSLTGKMGMHRTIENPLLRQGPDQTIDHGVLAGIGAQYHASDSWRLSTTYNVMQRDTGNDSYTMVSVDYVF